MKKLLVILIALLVVACQNPLGDKGGNNQGSTQSDPCEYKIDSTIRSMGKPDKQIRTYTNQGNDHYISESLYYNNEGIRYVFTKEEDGGVCYESTYTFTPTRKVSILISCEKCDR